MSSASGTMKAVVFNAIGDVSVETRPVPSLQDDHDVVVKVHAAGLCVPTPDIDDYVRRELHVFRGHEECGSNFIMGHEFTGTIVQKGAAVQSVDIGDKVVAPFTVSCLKCFFCKQGQTSRCESSLLFGCSALDGGQAEFVRVPQADGTVVKAPSTISDNALLLMADIWPTGFYGTTSAFDMLPGKDTSNATVVVIGCGPVGLCAVVAALDFKPRYLFAIDGVDDRLSRARHLGAEPLNFKASPEHMKQRIFEVTEGRGADVVVEAVGMSPALQTAYDVVRPFGAIASIGVHNREIPFSAQDGYGKNIRLQMGRCPVRSIFSQALTALESKQDLLEFMFDHKMPLSDAVEGYRLFDKAEAQKIVFIP